MRTILLKMTKISKNFSGFAALSEANFNLEQGEVHALLGANGAGKSTLIKILSGAYQPTSGEVFIDGILMKLSSPRVAKEKGIYCVYQEVDTALVAELTVLENLLIDRLATGKGLWFNKANYEQEANDALAKLNAQHISLSKKVKELTLADKQLVLIARALIQKAKLIILDEPTAPLSMEETKHLFRAIKDLKASGVGLVFISHRLPEVFDIADRITVMRDGKTIISSKRENINSEQLVKYMLGTKIEEKQPSQKIIKGEKLLEITNLSDGQKLEGISFHVNRGEVVGVFGLVGAGKTELAKSLFGDRPVMSGNISILGEVKTLKNPQEAIAAGIVLVPEERRKEGLFVHESVIHNVTFPSLKKFSKLLFMNRKKEKNHSLDVIDKLGVKTSHPEKRVHNLSGGNQQKIAIGKWLAQSGEVFLFDEPTKGVDIGAKQDIFELIHSFTREGKGVLYFSCEMSEILNVSDRILVLYDGMVVKEMTREEAIQEKIMLYASGGKEEVL